MKIPISKYTDKNFPNILVIGCGHVGERIVKSYVDSDEKKSAKVYVSDSNHDKARKLSEYRISSIFPIKFKEASDVPDEVDVIIVAVDYESESKLIEKVIATNKHFISLTDSSKVYEKYESQKENINESVNCILGTGLVPGISDVLIDKGVNGFDKTLDISIQRLGFVSKSSLSSVKNAIKEDPIRVIDGVTEELKRGSGSGIYWFPPPWGATECFPVGVGVKKIKDAFKEVHNISVKYAEPKLPTFKERLRNIFLKIPLTTTQACIRCETVGISNDEVHTRTLAIKGDAMKIIIATTIMSAVALHATDTPTDKKLLLINDVVDSNKLLSLLYDLDIEIMKFDPK